MSLFSNIPACRGSQADAVAALRQQPTQSTHVAFWPVRFVWTPLPLRPFPHPVRVTTNGQFVSTLTSGHVRDTSGVVRPVGLPYGMLARLIVLFLVTHAVRRGEPIVPLGPSLASFLRDLAVSCTGGSNGRIKYLYDQLARLSSCTLSECWSQYERDPKGRTAQVDMGTNGALVERFALWHRTEGAAHQPPKGCFELSPHFFETTRQAAIPLDIRAVHALRRHPLAFDAYSWATYTAARLEREGRRLVVVGWSQLHDQFGRPNRRTKDFAQAFCRALRLVQLVWPSFHFHTLPGRLVITSARPHVPRTLSR